VTERPEPGPDGLAGIRARVDEAYLAADRIVREAEEAARALAGSVPRNGWSAGVRPPGDPFPDLRPIVALIDNARHLVPPELAERLAGALREVLLALRALLDWWIERMERRDEPNPQVEDIPID
jgi:hypothetical protein